MRNSIKPLSYGVVVNGSDSCVYSKSNKHAFVIICLYANDMLVFGTSIEVIKMAKDFLNSNFEIKDLGNANLILRVKVKNFDLRFCVNQAQYAGKILRKFNHFALKSTI